MTDLSDDVLVGFYDETIVAYEATKAKAAPAQPCASTPRAPSASRAAEPETWDQIKLPLAREKGEFWVLHLFSGPGRVAGLASKLRGIPLQDHYRQIKRVVVCEVDLLAHPELDDLMVDANFHGLEKLCKAGVFDGACDTPSPGSAHLQRGARTRPRPR